MERKREFEKFDKVTRLNFLSMVLSSRLLDAYERTLRPSGCRPSAPNCSLGFEDGMEDEMDSGPCGKKETEPGGVDRRGMDKCRGG